VSLPTIQPESKLVLANRLLIHAAFCALASASAFAAHAGGIDRAAMDTSVAAGDDFWSYANGSWVKAHPIPADRS